MRAQRQWQSVKRADLVDRSVNNMSYMTNFEYERPDNGVQSTTAEPEATIYQ